MRRICGILSAIFILSLFMPAGSFTAEKSSGIIIPLSHISQEARQIKTLVGDYVVISPNKKTLGIWNRNAKTLTLYETSTWQAHKTFQGNYAAFSSDGKTLAIENDDKTVALYDTATWKQIQGFAEKSASFSPEKSSIKTPDTVTLYDTNTWQAIKTFVTVGDQNRFLYGDGRLLTVGNYSPSKTTFYDTRTGQEIKTLEIGTSYSDVLEFLGNGSFLIVGIDKAKKVTLYDTSTWQPIITFDGKYDSYGTTYVNKEGNVLVIRDDEAKKLILYDITTKESITSIIGSIDFDKNNKVYKVIDNDAKKLTLYDLSTRKAITTEGTRVEFDKDGKLLMVCGNKANKITLYDRATLQAIKTFDGDYANFDKDGKLLRIVAEESHKVTFYDTPARQVIKTFDGSSATSDEEGKIWTIHDDKTNKVTLYDRATWQEIKTFDGEYAYFVKSDKLLLVRDKNDNKLTLYDRATWQKIKAFDGEYAYFDKDGKLLYVPDEKANKVTLYDITTWQKIKAFDGKYVSFDKDSKLAYASDEKANKVTLYDITTGREITFDGTYVVFPKSGNILGIHDFKADKKTFFDAAIWQVIKIEGKFKNFKNDDKLLEVNSYEPHKTTIYNTATGQVIKTFDTSVDFLKGDKLLRVREANKTNIYDTTTWQMVKSFDTDMHLSFSGNMVSVPNPGKQLDFYAYNPDGIDLTSFFAKGDFETTKEYERRLSALELPYAFNVKLGGYDADRDGFEGEVKGTKVFIPVPRDKAKDIVNRKDKAHVEGKLKYFDPKNMQFIDAKFVDEATNDKYAVLKISEDKAVAYVPPKPAPVYAPKPTAQEMPAENIHDIPDFKSSPRNNDLAVIIGIENYRGLPKSDYSKSDAGIMKDYIKALGFQERNITFLTDDNASLSDIKKTLETWLQNNTKKESKVFIYYSGHGAPEPKTGDAYIVPFDGDPNYLEDTGYSLKRLYERLGKLQVAEVIVLLDSCFSGAGGRSVLAQGARPLVIMTTSTALPQNMAVLSATQGSQISTSSSEKGHGVFTYYFLKALKDGKKDIAEIYSYIKPLVEDEAKQINVQQSPSVSPDVEKLKGRFSLRK